MTAVTYTALRSIIGGHSINVSYSLDLSCTEITPSRRPSVTKNQSLSGRRESLRFFAEEIYSVELAPLAGDALAAVREFLDSVEAGEPFTFDPYGTSNVPRDPQAAEIDGDGYELPRTGRRGQGGHNDKHTLSFKVRVLQP